jgi:hypothetical protein
VCFTGDGTLLVTSQFSGSGGTVPLRLYDPASGEVQKLAELGAETMPAANGRRNIFGLAQGDTEWNPWGNLVLRTGKLTFAQGNGGFMYEVAVYRDASLFALPTYFGTLIANKKLEGIAVIDEDLDQAPVGAVFHPRKDLVYFPIADTSLIGVYSSTTWKPVDWFDAKTDFHHTGNYAYAWGREKISKNGSLLFVTVQDGVRYFRTAHHQD